MASRKSLLCIVTLSALLIAVGMVPCSSVVAADYTLTLDGSVRLGAVPHFWSECVGTGTMEYCLKPAWTDAARMGVQDAGFRRVRGHGILIHGNNADSIKLGSGPNWNFSVIDRIYDTVLACGLKPIVELSFMPGSLQSVSGKAYSPPNNYSTWKNLVAEFVKHMQVRYGAEEVRTWYWEVWNEFDYEGFWTGTPAQYYMLYDSAAAGVKSVDANIPVGGPASTSTGALQNFWNTCKSSPIDFLSNHQYGVGADSSKSLPTNIRNDNRARSDIIKATGRNLLSFNTEFNSSYSGQGGYKIPNVMSMDDHRNAPFIAKTVKLIIDDCVGGKYRYPDVLSYWSISDCFDEWWGNNSNSYIEGNNRIPFGQVFGLINYQGIKKATFNAYVMLHKMGTTGLKLTGGSGDDDGVDGFATVNTDSSRVTVMLYSYYNDLRTTGADDTARLVIEKLPFADDQQLTITHHRVDSLHSNPYGVWRKFNSPVTPTTAQWDSLRAHHNLEQIESSTTMRYTGASFTKIIALPRWSVSLLTFSRDITGVRHTGRATSENAAFALHGRTLIGVGLVRVTVHTAAGRLVRQMSSFSKTVDLGTGLPKGIYLARIETAGARCMKKFVIY